MHQIKPDTVYSRLAANPRASQKVRIAALRAIKRPSLSLLLRLIKGATPPRVLALAAELYDIECSVRRKDETPTTDRQ
jgi:hypothetical protein